MSDDTFCERRSVDSNITGLRFAQEICPGVLPENPVWNPLEPNSYSDFGGQYTSVARKPINPSRQRKKGVITDLDASGGFNQDVTMTNLPRILQGFMFADARERGNTHALAHEVASPVTATLNTDKSYTIEQSYAVSANATDGGDGYLAGEILTAVGGTFSRAAQFIVSEVIDGVIKSVMLADEGSYSVLPSNPVAVTSDNGEDATLAVVWDELMTIVAGDLVMASNFTNSANNGIKHAASFASSKLVVTETVVAETPQSSAQLEVIGHQFGAGAVSITLNSKLVRLSSTTFDFATLGFIPGEWIFVGGDDAAMRFANNTPGFARISVIYALTAGSSYIEFDKVTWLNPVADAGTGKTIQIFYGAIIRNESDPTLIKRRTYQLERTLGTDADGTRSEYLVGAVPSELTLNIPTADKLNVDLTFMAIAHEPRTGADGIKDGTRPSIVDADAFNTSVNVPVIQLATVTDDDATPSALFGFASDITLTINNNLSVLKAIGKLGGFDVSAGTFEVGGSQTVYFSGVESTLAVRNNADITEHFIFVAENAGQLWDIPLLSLGDGRNSIEADQPITVNLDQSAAESKFGNTLLFQNFSYLPDAAA